MLSNVRFDWECGKMTSSILILLALLPSGSGHGSGEIYTSTFSIVAMDTLTGEYGVAVASKVLDVGYIVPWGEPGVGAVATQAQTNAMFGPDGLDLLRDGASAEEVLEELLELDPEREVRQLGIVDSRGGSASFTGSETMDWAGSITGPAYAIQGNILTGPEVVTDMEQAFLQEDGPLGDRLLAALLAGDAAGGDSRGRQSAAMVIYREGGGYQESSDLLVDIRVADSQDPLGDLERIYSKWCMWFVFPVYIDAEYPETEYALDIMDDYVESGDIDAQDLNGLAWELATRKLYPERAVEIALMAIEMEPEDANIMDTVAESYYSLGDFDRAVEWESKALDLEPDNVFFNQQLEKFRNAISNRPPLVGTD
jgi:uncharacterized Ntn-hydrolase superfamily protein